MQKLKRTFRFIYTHPLAGKHLFRAFLNFFWWQLQSRCLPGRLLKKKFVADTKFYARNGMTGVTGNIYTGLHEFHDMAFLLHVLRPGDLFCDIGANVGSYTLLASGVCKAFSVALEPDPVTFGILEKNIQLNGLGRNVKLFNAGAGGEAGTIRFSTGEDTTNHVLAAGENVPHSMLVPVIAADDFLRHSTPFLIKIDVEGFETEVLRGMPKVLGDERLQAIIIELNGSGARYGFDESAIHQLLLTSGLQPHLYDPFSRQLTRADTFGNYNTIYVRQPELVMQRLQTAKSLRIMGAKI